MSPLHQLGRARWSLLHGMDKVAEKALDLGLVISEEVCTVRKIEDAAAAVVAVAVAAGGGFLGVVVRPVFLHRYRMYSLCPPSRALQLASFCAHQ